MHPAPYQTVTLLTDYGSDDEFVGVLKSVIWSIAPAVRIVDLCHDIAPFDIRAAGLMLARSVNYLCPGVVVAVVDPGVGTARRAVAVEVGGGQSVLVGPDNGLLAPAVAMVGGAGRTVELTNTDHQLEPLGPTFAGRDVFGPAAAHLCLGVALEQLGPLVDPVGLMPGLLPIAHEDNGATVAEVSEAQLDAVTGLSGSGPAYVFLVAEALIEAGVLCGLARPVAQQLAVQTLLGSATLLSASLAESSRGPGDLRADVTSPGGTTAAGLRVLEQRAVRAAFLDAVSAAAARSAELGNG